MTEKPHLDHHYICADKTIFQAVAKAGLQGVLKRDDQLGYPVAGHDLDRLYFTVLNHNDDATQKICDFLAQADIATSLRKDPGNEKRTFVCVDKTQPGFLEAMRSLIKKAEAFGAERRRDTLYQTAENFRNLIPLNEQNKPIEPERGAEFLANGIRTLQMLARDLDLNHRVDALLSPGAGMAVPARGGANRPVARGD